MLRFLNLLLSLICMLSTSASARQQVVSFSVLCEAVVLFDEMSLSVVQILIGALFDLNNNEIVETVFVHGFVQHTRSDSLRHQTLGCSVDMVYKLSSFEEVLFPPNDKIVCGLADVNLSVVKIDNHVNDSHFQELSCGLSLCIRLLPNPNSNGSLTK